MRINLLNVLGALTCSVLVSLGSTSQGWARTYYVSPAGNDANTGVTTSSAFKTIQKSLNMVQPGDVVNIMAGTYYESLALMRTGTSTARITVKNHDGAVVIVNSGNSRAIKLNAVIGYYTIDGITFISNYVGKYINNSDYSIDLGVGGPGWWGYGYPVDSAVPVDDDSNGHNGFIIQNCNITGSIGIQGHNNVVRNCTLNGNNAFTNGIFDFTVVSHKNTYTHNTIRNYTDRAVWSMSNTYEITVSHNDISHWGAKANPAAIDFDGAWLPIYNSVIANNVIHDGDGNNSMGMQFENGMNCICENNTIYNVVHGMTVINYTKSGQGSYGFGYYNFQVQDPSHLVMGRVPYVANNVLRNNVVYNTSRSGLLLNMSWGNSVYNNTFDSCGGLWGAILLANGGTGTGSVNTTVTNNMITNSTHGVTVEPGSSIRSQTNNLFYNNGSNGTTGSAAQTGNPVYTNQSGHVYTLQAGSAAIDKGATIAAVKTDKNGVSRPGGSAYDIGAYEYGGTPVQFTVTASAGSDGTISPSGTTAVAFGTSITYVVKPNAGYRITGVMVDGVSVGAVSSYMFGNVAANHTIAASFAPDVADSAQIPQTGWALKYRDSEQSVNPANPASYAFDGQADTFWHTQYSPASAGYPHEIQINLGESYRLDGFSYLPRQDGTPNGTIAQYEFYVSTDGVNWGPAVAAGVFANTSTLKTISFPAKIGRYIRLRALSEVNGNAWASVAEIGVTGTSLALTTYTITGSAETGGTISPPGASIVNGGGSQSYTIIPSPGYRIASVSVDSVSVGAISSYSFSNVTANHTIRATFSLITQTDMGPVWITSPAAGASVKGTIPILAAVADGSSVTKVEFYLDGALLGSDSSSPYTFSWSTVSTASGAHVLTAKAYHAAAEPSVSSPVTVVLRRVPKAPRITVLK